jgi:hypothetical protein
MEHFGTGPTLAESNPWLKDPAERHRRILDVAERNSVIEGLPPFTQELREHILCQLRSMGGRERG